MTETEKKEEPIFIVIHDTVPQSFEDYALNYAPKSWSKLFSYALPDLRHVDKCFKEKGITAFYPHISEVFKAYEYCALEKIKVVIFGQDPYHGLGQANGLAFSVKRNITIPPSLLNIYKELQREYGKEFKIPKHGDLTNWALQGVLLLNTTLTVTPGIPNSHCGYWMGFIHKTIEYILKTNQNCIFMLWGNEAQKLLPKLGELSIKLLASHPSSYSVSIQRTNIKPFNLCDHFVLANNYLVDLGKSPIDWRISD